jgi:DnaJ-class molecular chaperone
MGKRINASQCVAVLGQIIDTLKANMPTHVCPACCGTGELEAKNGQQPEKCRYCDGYGIVDKETYSRLKAMWKQTRARLLIIRGAN